MSSTRRVLAAAKKIDHAYTFPPFPPTPEAVTLVPFKDFTEYGTRLVGKGGIERDGLGIPTIALPPKTPRVTTVVGSSRQKEWWRDWESTLGDLCRGPHDPNLNRVDWLLQSVTAFSEYLFPHYSPESIEHLQQIWVAFRHFIGLNEPTQSGIQSVNVDEEVSDDDYEKSTLSNQQPAGTHIGPAGVQRVDGAFQNEVENKATDFLNNPVKSLKIFLSSHMYDKGLMWSSSKLVSAPHLLCLFMKFLMLHKVLPEHTHSLHDTLEVIELAGIELPLIPLISKALPDAFSAACQLLWGRKLDYFLQFDPPETESIRAEPKSKRATHANETEEHIEQSKIDGAEAALHTAAGAQNVDMEDPAHSVGLGRTGDANMDTGLDGGGWGSDFDAWSASDPIANEPTSTPVTPRPTLLTLFGPSAFSLTHTPGIVEWSVRRIKSVSAPAVHVRNYGIGAEAVERDLEARMYRVVLEPWVGIYPAAVPPHILGCSVGARVPAVATSSEQPKAHDVHQDEITVLVEPETAKLMCQGMGLGGRWVQLARVQDCETMVGANVPDDHQKLTKCQEARRGLRYWYIDEHVMVVPSYWTV
ncbi:hypothetical protein DFH06DRAFT_1130463 [Mycena polygramma]|nr:hypothetical protein DFH06DRAFT_1130463 [Mycena polygramma]